MTPREEIEQLKAIVESLSDHHVAAERMDFIRSQGAEIERLKAAEAHLIDMANQADVACVGMKYLLAEAADKFERLTWKLDFVDKSIWEAHEVYELIAELRKAAE